MDDSNKKLYLLSAVAFLLVIKLIFIPMKDKANDAQEVFYTELATNKKINTLLSQQEAVEFKLNELVKFEEAVTTKLKVFRNAEAHKLSFQPQIEDLLDSLNIKVKRLYWDEEQESDGKIKQVRCRLTLSGDFLDVLKLHEKLSSLQPSLQVFSISISDKAIERPAGEVSISLILDTFYIREEKNG